MDPLIIVSPQGTKDGSRLNDILASYPRNSGPTIVMRPGLWAIDEPVMGKALHRNGAEFRGYGGAVPNLSGDAITKCYWSGPEGGGPMFDFEGDGEHLQDIKFSGICLDAARKAVNGIRWCALANSNFERFSLMNTLGAALYSTANEAGDTAWNRMAQASMFDVGMGMYLTGSDKKTEYGTAVRNTCHNVFDGVNIQDWITPHTCETGIWLDDSDNNNFISVLTPGTAKVGVQINDPMLARANYFYHLQAGGEVGMFIWNAEPGFNPPYRTRIFGYDTSNGETQPKTDSGRDWHEYVLMYD